MKALCWNGKQDVRIEDVPEPRLINPHDIIVRTTSTAICGSDLHLYDGYIPSMRKGDILGHEFMGIVEEVGTAVGNLAPGDRVLVPFPISCGNCFFCKREEWSLCDNTNPNAAMTDLAYGHSGAGIFGYSHLLGGYAGGQAEYVRVPFGNVGPIKVPDNLSDEQVLFLTDIFPTGYMAAENCEIQPGDVIAIWGAGPVGLFAIKSAILLGAERVIAIDRIPERLALAEEAGAIPVDFEKESVMARLRELTGGRGPDACIDAVGLEAHSHGFFGKYDKLKQTLRLETDRPQALREAIYACRKGGIISVPGVYGGLLDKFPLGAAFGKALRFKMGQTHVHRYLRPLLERIQRGDIDPSFVISHRFALDEAPEAYRLFAKKRDGCTKVVLACA